MREALCYTTVDRQSVQCELCRHACLIPEGSRGICQVRENRKGILYALSSGIIVAEQIDPIEKKPLYHLLPGSRCYSLASVGCNFSCFHCQNHEIAQYVPADSCQVPGRLLEPAQVVERALKNGCRSVAFTYTEPTVWFEYTLETARLAVAAGLYTVYVTNGYMSSQALSLISPCLHAANIDLKGFSADFYTQICGARLDRVLESIREFRRLGIWLEITTLLIPGLNDDQQQLEGIARFIADELGSDTPWHISRFFPRHRLSDRPPTPASSLNRAVDAGIKAGLHYIYVGNSTPDLGQTYCPSCGLLLVERNSYNLTRQLIQHGACPHCQQTIAGIWE